MLIQVNGSYRNKRGGFETFSRDRRISRPDIAGNVIGDEARCFPKATRRTP
jgi:hypothetical protein